MAAKYTVEIYKDKKRQYRWRVKHSNGNVVANGGDGIFNREDCLTSLTNMANGIATAKLVDLTETKTNRRKFPAA